jgi:hypothetical protein
MKLNIVLLTLVLITPMATHVHAAPDRLLAPIHDQGSISGCSWSASSSAVGRGFIYLAELDGSRTLMNIDGVDTDLKLIAEQGRLLKVGDVLDREFKSGDISVRVHYKATWVCPKDSESCEVTEYSAIFDVSKGSRRQRVQASGGVGC